MVDKKYYDNISDEKLKYYDILDKHRMDGFSMLSFMETTVNNKSDQDLSIFKIEVKHIDQIIDMCKNFFTVSVTGFIAVLAIPTNIQNTFYIIKILGLILALSLISGTYYMIKRKYVVENMKKVNEKYSDLFFKITENQVKINDINTQCVDEVKKLFDDLKENNK